MATINFYYRSTKEQANLTAKLRFSEDKENFVITAKTPIRTSLEVWSKRNAKRIDDVIIRNEVLELLKKLSDLEAYLIDSFENEVDKNRPQQKQWLTDTIEDFFNSDKEQPTKLTKYIDFYLEVRKNELKKQLRTKFETLKQKIVILETEKKHQYEISEVNESFKNLFIDFYTKNNYSKNYIKKHFSFLKQVCNHAKYNGLEVSPQLDKLNIKGEKTPKIYLTTSELEKIEAKTFERENLEATKDWLIISCYTGQRVSDFLRFTPEMIRTENGKNLIEFTQQKTEKKMTIPVHAKVLQIIEKNGGKFPKRLLDQKYNKYLKEVCKNAEVNEPIEGRKSINIGTEKKPVYRYKTDIYPKYELISSHVGRRSFATNFYGKIPTTFLIYITGHSTEAMFLNYIGKSNKDLALEVSDYFNTL